MIKLCPGFCILCGETSHTITKTVHDGKSVQYGLCNGCLNGLGGRVEVSLPPASLKRLAEAIRLCL